MSLTPTQRRADLLDAEAAGRKIEILAFHGRRPSPDGLVGPETLSPWWWQPFTVEGVEYPTPGHYTIAEKARLFGDSEALTCVLGACSVPTARAAGRRMRRVDVAYWYDVAFGVVVQGKLAQMGQHKELRDFLLSTAQQVPVKASPSSRVWGVGLALGDPRLRRPSQWAGLNYFGFAVAAARELLIEGVEL